jgi:hypothetical protein
MEALQPLPTRLTSIRYPLYSMGVCAGQDLAGNAPALALFRRPPDSVGLSLKCRLRARRAPVAPPRHRGFAQGPRSRDSKQPSGERQVAWIDLSASWQHFAPNSANRCLAKFDPC